MTAPHSKPLTIRTSGETESDLVADLRLLQGTFRPGVIGHQIIDRSIAALPSLISRAEAAEEEVKRLREATTSGVFIEPDYAEELARALRMISDSLEGHRSRSTNFNGEIVRFSTVIERAAKQFDRHASPAKPSEQTNDQS
ncbi:MAG: hypothetical protein Q7T61_01175 [Caulobacter sp.]|nr:hypothetical protein [Caulobacter sp.]